MRGVADLPLGRDDSSRLLPWLIAFMVWLAALALAAAMILSSAGTRWRNGLTGTLTVQIAPIGGEGPEALQPRVEAALKLVRDTPGVAQATALPDSEILKLIEPWLGKAALSGDFDLPLPRLIDVRLAGGAHVDTAALGARLARIPGTTLDDHGRWLDRLLALAGAVEGIAYVALGLIGLAAVATVVFTTRTGLAIHRDEIELLHLIGARDAYVARQFQTHALALGLKGGLGGIVLAAITLAVLVLLSNRLGAGLMPRLALSPVQWGALAGLVGAAALISMATARITVLRTLERMP